MVAFSPLNISQSSYQISASLFDSSYSLVKCSLSELQPHSRISEQVALTEWARDREDGAGEPRQAGIRQAERQAIQNVLNSRYEEEAQTVKPSTDDLLCPDRPIIGIKGVLKIRFKADRT